MQDPNLAFIVAAYAITWGVLLGYLVRVHRALAQARAEFESASKQMENAR
jgi:CcmD family protein